MSHVAPDALSVTVERDIPYPPDRVWRALTQPHLISEWLMKTDFRAEAGAKFSLSGDWGGVNCEVLEIDEPNTLSYTWDYDHEDTTYALKSVVTFTLTPSAKGTQLRMEQVGFRPDQKQAFHGARAGWTGHLENLEKTIAGHEQGGAA